MSEINIRFIVYKIWNRINAWSFQELAEDARIHPLSVLRGRKAIKIGSQTTILSHATVDAFEPGSMVTIGKRCIINSYAMLMTYGGHIKIGDDCSVNPYCVIYGHGGLTIGNGVRIAAGTVIIPANHIYKDVTTPIFKQDVSKKGIAIEDDVWIGANVTILDGVRIGTGSVVAAGAVVASSVDPFTIVGGVPAKIIKLRAAASAS